MATLQTRTSYNSSRAPARLLCLDTLERSLNFFFLHPVQLNPNVSTSIVIPSLPQEHFFFFTQFPDLSGEVIPRTQSALVSPGLFSFARRSTHAPRALFSRSRVRGALFCDRGRPPPPFARRIHPLRGAHASRPTNPPPPVYTAA